MFSFDGDGAILNSLEVFSKFMCLWTVWTSPNKWAAKVAGTASTTGSSHHVTPAASFSETDRL